LNPLRVAAGILRDDSGRVLIAQRLEGGPFNGLWEFPGGKIVADERPIEALTRELAEELGIRVTTARPLIDLRHAYADREVELWFFLVTRWQGEPRGVEQQQLRWVPVVELDAEILLPADQPVVEALQALRGTIPPARGTVSRR
jgi:8-oxo-dGTP diphosphatase